MRVLRVISHMAGGIGIVDWVLSALLCVTCACDSEPRTPTGPVDAASPRSGWSRDGGAADSASAEASARDSSTGAAIDGSRSDASTMLRDAAVITDGSAQTCGPGAEWVSEADFCREYAFMCGSANDPVVCNQFPWPSEWCQTRRFRGCGRIAVTRECGTHGGVSYFDQRTGELIGASYGDDISTRHGNCSTFGLSFGIAPSPCAEQSVETLCEFDDAGVEDGGA